jgi:DNA-binding transcriptional regulator YiaG
VVEEVELPGLTPIMMRVLCFLAEAPWGVEPSQVSRAAEVSALAGRKALGRLVDLGWAYQSDRVTYRVTSDGLRLACMWQLTERLAGKESASFTPAVFEPVEPLELLCDQVLRARQELGMSQAELARALVSAGKALGHPNNCTKRLVQKWESGDHAALRPNYAEALAVVTGRADFARENKGNALNVDAVAVGGPVVVGLWAGNPVALLELADRVGRLTGELAQIRLELAKFCQAPSIGL